jgi:hypothetical protein
MEHIEPIIKEKLEKAINNYLEGEKVEESIKHTGETAKSIGESFKIIKVRCIKNYNGQLDISIDKEYPIDKEEESFYYIKDDKGINKKYSKFLFEKVEDVLMVECIENDNIEGKLTINKVYLVLKIEDDLYLIKDDLGQTLKLAQSRFKTVEPQKEYTVMELLDFPVGTKLKDNENNIVEIIESIGGTKEDKEIRCTWISKDSPFGNSLILSTGWKRKRFTLVEQPKTVTTSEAFKALEEGKIIESLVTHDRYSKGVKTINIELHDEREEGFNKCMNISIAELEGQWIIIESEGK